MPLAESIRTFDVAFLGLGSFGNFQSYVVSEKREGGMLIQSQPDIKVILQQNTEILSSSPWFASIPLSLLTCVSPNSLSLDDDDEVWFSFHDVCGCGWLVNKSKKKLRHALMTTHAAQRYLERIKFTPVSFRDGFNFRWDNIDAVKKLITFGQITHMRASRFQFVGLRASLQNVTLSTVDRSQLCCRYSRARFQRRSKHRSYSKWLWNFKIAISQHECLIVGAGKFIETSAIVAECCLVVVKRQHVDSWQNYS